MYCYQQYYNYYLYLKNIFNFIKFRFKQFFKIFGSITLTSKTNYATVEAYKLNDDEEGFLSSFIRILTNSIQLLNIDLETIEPKTEMQKLWLQILNNTTRNQTCSIMKLKERFYTNFKAEKFSQYIQQFITSLPQQLSNIFASKYHCSKCNKVYNLFSTQQRQSCDQCGGNLLLQKPSSIAIQFVDKQQQILRKTIIDNQDYVLYTVLGCKKENDLKFYQILVDFEFIQSDQLYILNRPQNCILTSKVDPLTYLKPEKVHKYLQNQKENSVAKTIGQPQMIMYFNANDLQGRAKQNVAEQFDIQPKEQPKEEQPQPQIIQPIVLPKEEKQPEPSPILKQEEPLQPQVEVTNYGYIAVLFYIISLILLFITMVIISCAIGKVNNNYKPKGLIIKNNLVFEGEQAQNNLSQKQIKLLKANNNKYQKTLVIKNVNISDLTFNNTKIDNYTGDQNTCKNVQLTQSNLQTAKNINIQSDNFTASTLQTNWSRVQANNSQINVLTAQSINLQSINSTNIEAIQQQADFNDLYVSTAQTSDLNCNKTLFSTGSVVADNTEIKNTIASNTSTINRLTGADLEVTRKLTGYQIDTNQIQIYSNISQFTINSEQETILNGNITSKDIILNNQTTIQNASADVFQVLNNAVTISQQLDTQNFNGTTASNITVRDTLSTEKAQGVRISGNNLTIVDQGNITSYLMNISSEGNITVNQSYKQINFDSTQVKIEDNNNVTLTDINFDIPNLILQGNQIQIENITTTNITEAKQIDTNELEGRQSQISNYTISNNTQVSNEFNKLDNVELNARIYTTLAEKYTMKKRDNDTVEQDLIGYDNQVKGIYITTDFNRANKYTITNGSVEECR